MEIRRDIKDGFFTVFTWRNVKWALVIGYTAGFLLRAFGVVI